jgi:hypothetical protein
VEGSSSFRGAIDSVFVFNAALSVEELNSLRTSSYPLLPPTAGSAGYSLALNTEYGTDVTGDNQFMLVESHPLFSTLSEVSRVCSPLLLLLLPRISFYLFICFQFSLIHLFVKLYKQ